LEIEKEKRKVGSEKEKGGNVGRGKVGQSLITRRKRKRNERKRRRRKKRERRAEEYNDVNKKTLN